MLRLTNSDRSAAEIAAVAEHVAGLTAAAAGLRVDGHSPLVSLPDGPDRPQVQVVWDEIRQWARASLDRDDVPVFWRLLTHQPRLLEATWRKDRIVMADGSLDGVVKTCVALAVAAFRQSGYWIDCYSQMLRHRHGFDDEALVEIAGAVMHYASFNTIAHGMRLAAPVAELTSADVAPDGPLEHLVPGVRRRVSPRAADER
ncbi:MAG: carboxymuconolactone decarboxylase family protein [Vicinamibacterales bacterium]